MKDLIIKIAQVKEKLLNDNLDNGQKSLVMAELQKLNEQAEVLAVKKLKG